MKRFPKFSILEIDGIELDYNQEYEPVGDDVYYDETKGETIREFLDETSFGYKDFFKYELDADLTIPVLRSKIITDCINVNTRSLVVNGIMGIF